MTVTEGSGGFEMVLRPYICYVPQYRLFVQQLVHIYSSLVPPRSVQHNTIQVSARKTQPYQFSSAHHTFLSTGKLTHQYNYEFSGSEYHF